MLMFGAATNEYFVPPRNVRVGACPVPIVVAAVDAAVVGVDDRQGGPLVVTVLVERLHCGAMLALAEQQPQARPPELRTQLLRPSTGQRAEDGGICAVAAGFPSHLHAGTKKKEEEEKGRGEGGRETEAD